MAVNYAKGIYWNVKHEKAPDFVLGKITLKPEYLIPWLEEQATDDKGYVRLQVKMGKDDKPYVAVDDWTPEKKAKEAVEEDDDYSKIPF